MSSRVDFRAGPPKNDRVWKISPSPTVALADMASGRRQAYFRFGHMFRSPTLLAVEEYSHLLDSSRKPAQPDGLERRS